MGLTSDGIGLLFTAKGDTSDAKKAFNDLKNSASADIDALEKSGTGGTSKLAGGFSALAGPAGIAAGAIAAVATVAVSAAVGLFALAKSASDFGSMIKDASEKTGLGAKSLSALKFAADQSGSSFEQITKGVTKFTLLIGDAAKGSDTAAASLKSLGIDPQAAIKDLDGALSQVIKRIYEAKPGLEQNTLAADAFGKKLGADLIPTINTTKGEFSEFIKEAERLGVVLTDEDAAAADAFGDTLDTLSAQSKGIANQFALGFAPAITRAMEEISGSLAGNKNVWREWGEFVGGVILRMTRGVRVLAAVVQDMFSGNLSGDNLSKAVDTNAAGYANDARLKAISDAGANRPDFLKEQDAAIKKASKSSVSNYFGDTAGTAKKAGKVAGESFDKGFRDFAKDNDFIVNSVLRKGKQINSGSKHATAQAGDLSIKGKSIQEIVDVLANGIKKGYRAIDERFVGAIPGVKSTGPNAHFESAGSQKPSLFVNNRPDLYGGADNLAYLKKLDADRRAGKTSVDEIAAFTKKRVEDEKKADEEIVKTRETADRRVLENAKRTAAEEKAINDNLLAKKLISQDEYDRRSEQSELDLLLKEKILLEERLALAKQHGTDTVGIENEIAAAVSQIKIKQTEDETAAYLKSKKYAEDLKALRLEVADTERQLIDTRKQGERENLEEDLKNARGNSNRLTALIVLREFDIKEADRRREQSIAEATRERDEALANIEDKEKEKEKLEEINKKYLNRLEIINAIREAEGRKVEKDFKPEIQDASRSDAEQTIDDIFGLSDATVDRVTGKVNVLKGVFNDLGASVKTAAKGMVQALGSAIEGYLLYGESIGKALKKAAAAELAHIASVSAIKAIYQLAQGFAALFVNPAAAAAHFQAAALYGVVAVGAGLSAKALAGDSFKQQTATGGASNGQGNGNGQTSGRGFTGGAFSSSGDKVTTFENGINTAQVVRHEIKLGSENYIFDVLENNVSKNGRMRDLFADIAAGAQ